MPVLPPLPLRKRVPPGVWTSLPWCAGLVFMFVARGGLRGLHGNAWMYLAGTSALVLAGGILLRRRPLPALGLLLAAMFAGVPPGVAETPVAVAKLLTVDVGLYFVAAHSTRRTGIIALVGALAVLAGWFTLGLPHGVAAEVGLATTAVIAWLVGHTVRQAREHAQSKIAWATAQAVADERLRISRELHDTLAHSVGVIALQAGAARRVIDTQPERAAQALGDIENAGREALSGLRRTLGVLRRPEEAPPSDPMPGLGDIERLAAATTEAGVRVEVRLLGERRPLPPEIDVSAYRIIQEAVTNVVRHAGTGWCRVSVEYRDDEVVIEVLDGGRGPHHAGGGGFGLVGMRERVTLLQGRLSAEPRPEGGFRVAARLPLTTGTR
ncbi:sensor histidine kinase [Rhizohabitans arisaemae]|uniref:sensor histidine kinase n=1 Tax=Rhizohabitans arisaemae TaxID=2720610 RepID=UPI0024B22FF6|nr:sensor histidine kinase [Rhizohabitans arisaemae]